MSHLKLLKNCKIICTVPYLLILILISILILITANELDLLRQVILFNVNELDLLGQVILFIADEFDLLSRSIQEWSSPTLSLGTSAQGSLSEWLQS